MLADLLEAWWERIGNTPASAIHKIMMSEARNFPEIAEFYTRGVIQPANELLARTLRRGIARGEFRSVPVRETTVVLFAPMLFMSLQKYSLGACEGPSAQVDTSRMIETHIDIVINGLLQRPALP